MFDSTELLIIQQLARAHQDELELLDKSIIPSAAAGSCEVMILALIGIGETISNHIEQ